MKVDFNKPFLDIDDKPIIVGDEPLNLGQVLANNLQRYTKGDSSKIMYWARKLRRKEALELDPTDTTVLRNMIESFEVDALYRAQWVQVFIDAKDIEKPKD